MLQKVSQLVLVGFSVLFNILKVYQSRTPEKCFFPRWRPKWPPTPPNDRKSVTIGSNLMVLMSISRFMVARNTLKLTNMASNMATGTSIFPTFHHSNVVIFVSIFRFMDARITLRQLWISLSCWIIMTLNSWPSAVHYHLMHKHLCPQSTFQRVQFWVSSSSSCPPLECCLDCHSYQFHQLRRCVRQRKMLKLRWFNVLR